MMVVTVAVAVAVLMGDHRAVRQSMAVAMMTLTMMAMTMAVSLNVAVGINLPVADVVGSGLGASAFLAHKFGELRVGSAG